MQAGVSQLHVDAGVDHFGLCLQPCCRGGQQVARRHDALLETGRGRVEVFFCFLAILQGEPEAFGGLLRLKGVEAENALREASVKFFARFAAVERAVKARGKEMTDCDLAELDENHIVTSLTDVFSRILMMFYERGLYRFLDNAELDVVLRKYGDDRKTDLMRRLDTTLHELFSYFSIEDENDINAFRSGYEALLYLLLSYDRLHEKEKALRFLIRGLVLQMVE